MSQRIDELRSAEVDEFIAMPFGSYAEGRARTRGVLREYDVTLGS